MQGGFIGFQGLFHSRNDDPFQTAGIDPCPLGPVTEQRGDLSDTNLGGLFQEPFEAVRILDWRDSQMKCVREGVMIQHPGKDLQPATFGVVLLDHRLIPASFSIHQVYGVTGPEPEHPDRVARFFFIQFCEISRNTGTIKKTHDRT